MSRQRVIVSGHAESQKKILDDGAQQWRYVENYAGIYAVDLDGKKTKTILRGLFGRPLAHDRGRDIIYLVAHGERMAEYLKNTDATNWGGHIHQIDLRTDKTSRLDNTPDDVDPLSLRMSPDGHNLSFKIVGNPDHFYIYDTRTKEIRAAPVRLRQLYSDYNIKYYRTIHYHSRIRINTYSLNADKGLKFPVVSPYTWISDEELVYTADDESLIKLNVHTQALEKIGEGCVFPKLLSPDGRYVLCQDRRGDPPHKLSLHDVASGEIIDIYRSFLPMDSLLLRDRDSKSLLFSKKPIKCSLKMRADYLLNRQMLQTVFFE